MEVCHTTSHSWSGRAAFDRWTTNSTRHEINHWNSYWTESHQHCSQCSPIKQRRIYGMYRDVQQQSIDILSFTFSSSGWIHFERQWWKSFWAMFVLVHGESKEEMLFSIPLPTDTRASTVFEAALKIKIIEDHLLWVCHFKLIWVKFRCNLVVILVLFWQIHNNCTQFSLSGFGPSARQNGSTMIISSSQWGYAEFWRQNDPHLNITD